MKRILPALVLITLCAMLCACATVRPEISGTPTPSASPTPQPEGYLAEVTGPPVPTDLLGKEIENENHYFQYLAFGDIRVYEYENGTFLDGICVNGYPLPLDGTLNIVYYTEQGQICGSGTIYNATGDTELATGSNAIYADINTDIDVRLMDFQFAIVTPFQPVEKTPE